MPSDAKWISPLTPIIVPQQVLVLSPLCRSRNGGTGKVKDLTRGQATSKQQRWGLTPGGATTRVCSFCRCVWHHAWHIVVDQQMPATLPSLSESANEPRGHGVNKRPVPSNWGRMRTQLQSSLPCVGLWLHPHSSEYVESGPGHEARFSQRDSRKCDARKARKGASLVAQWLGICLPMQGTRVRALVWEDPTCRGATKPVSHSY